MGPRVLINEIWYKPAEALSKTPCRLRKGTSVTWHQRELTLDDVLSDPITKEVTDSSIRASFQQC